MEKWIRRRRRRINAKAFALSLASVAAIALALFQKDVVTERVSGWMRLSEVVWEEAGSTNLSHRVTRDLLWNASGLKLETPTLGIDLADLEKRLLAIPWLESVQIQKTLPGTLLIKYVSHHARALGLRKGRPWLISTSGRWVAPLDKAVGDLDLPLLVNPESVEQEMRWLEVLERELAGELVQVHEVGVAPSGLMKALIEIRYAAPEQKESALTSGRITLIGGAPPSAGALPSARAFRLKRVIQYLIKNNILVSSIDLRAGQKVVVNVGKGP